MPDHTPSYRAEPDDEFANRLERELLRRLTAGASASSTSSGDTLVILEPRAQDDPPGEPPFADTTRVVLEPRVPSHRWRVVAAAAAVILLAAAAVVVYQSSDDTTQIEPADVTPSTGPPEVTSTTDPAAYVAVADSFMEAWVAGDGDAVVDLIGDPLWDHEDYSPVRIGLVAVPAPGWDSAIGDVTSLRALHDWFRAVGFDLHREPCRLVAPSAPEVHDSASVNCEYSYENDLTRAAGRPATTELLALMVVGDAVAEVTGGMFDLDADLWLMFSDWLRSEHPDDVAAMYRSSTTPPTPRLDEASIALWERHVDEFVASPIAHTPPSAPLTRAQFGARARMICAAASAEAQAIGLSWGTLEGLEPASRQAMEGLRTLPRPEEDRAEIDELMSLLEDVNRYVIANSWYHNDAFYSLQGQKDALGGRDFWGCPVGPLGG